MLSIGAHLHRPALLAGRLLRLVAAAAALAGLSALAPCANAGPIVGGTFGYSRGVLQRQQAETVAGYASQGFLGYERKGWSAHAFAENVDLAYAFAGELFRGIYTLSGVGAGYAKQLESGILTTHIQVPLTSTFIVLSETTGSVNGTDYVNSTLTTLQGKQAYQALVGYQLRVVGSGRPNGENCYVGLLFGYMSQTFDKQSTRIKTNDSVLAPASPGTESVTYSLTMMSLMLSAQFNM